MLSWMADSCGSLEHQRQVGMWKVKSAQEAQVEIGFYQELD